MTGPGWRARLVVAVLWLAAAGCGIENRYWLFGPGDLKVERVESEVIGRPLPDVWSAAERRLADLHASCPASDRQSGLLSCSLPEIEGSRPHVRKPLEGVAYVTVLLRPLGQGAT